MAWPMTGTMFVDIKEPWWIFFLKGTHTNLGKQVRVVNHDYHYILLSLNVAKCC